MVQSHLLMIRHWLFFSHQMILILASMMLTLLNEVYGDGIAKRVVALSADQLGELRHRTLSSLKGDYSYRMFS